MNEFADKNRDYIIKAYTVEGKSTYQIAEALGVPPKRIQRALVSLGVPRRSYGEAQSNALKTGAAAHPTKGKTYDKDKRERMSDLMAKYWDSMSEEERERRSHIGKLKWEEKTDAEKEAMSSAAAEACRKAAKEGSKLEKYLKTALEEDGYPVEFHKTNLTSDERLEVDLYIPQLKLAIEIDGISHFEPVWGEERLRKHQSADTKKVAMLLSAGYNILRVKQVTKTLSDKKRRATRTAILEALKQFSLTTCKLVEIEA